RFDFRRIGPHAIVDRLRHVVSAEGLSADDEALHLIAKSADGGMRDGLSILDQVVSFGEGPVTAARVREVLGLSSDDVYGELLLLRWAMMSRTVAIGQVSEALGMRQPGSGMRDAGSGPATPPVLRDTSSGAPPASRIPHPDLPPPEKGPLTLDRLRALWTRIV